MITFFDIQEEKIVVKSRYVTRLLPRFPDVALQNAT